MNTKLKSMRIPQVRENQRTDREPVASFLLLSNVSLMMPSFSLIALDRLLEPEASNSPSKNSTAPESNLERRNTAPLNGDDSTAVPERHSVLPYPKLGRRNLTPLTTEKKAQWPKISPSLYATPASAPLPDPPTSFPPSPYIINHKRRGPRLMESFSEQNSSLKKEELEGNLVNGRSSGMEVEIKCSDDDVVTPNSVTKEKVNGLRGVEIGDSETGNDLIVENGQRQDDAGMSTERDGEIEDFFDPQESMSITSNTDVEDNNAERSAKISTSGGEFFDAWEELSSDSGQQRQSSIYDLEAQLREMRLNFLMEIEKRKQAEEALNNLRRQWEMLTQKLRGVGLVLHVDPATSSDIDPAEEICQQVYFVRSVSESIGIEFEKAEAQEEIEAQLEVKNFEIARLCDRLHYYEAMNREMSQRNQEAIEVARRNRHRRKRRQMWIWGSIAVAITLGTAALAWSYIPSGKGASATDHIGASKPDNAAE
ncbi:hypothetical protein Nepgr_026413 [Nepenthes gracilis]|uniref:Uncharacterized protein n=1 Tax=Nepenthes gracilis TaxID=150966 RepID=A0AAD3Y206_NEPGR|nr:hypothetical protein Nepgr_026413 [Nepenthes gracilis]